MFILLSRRNGNNILFEAVAAEGYGSSGDDAAETTSVAISAKLFRRARINVSMPSGRVRVSKETNIT